MAALPNIIRPACAHSAITIPTIGRTATFLAIFTLFVFLFTCSVARFNVENSDPVAYQLLSKIRWPKNLKKNWLENLFFTFFFVFTKTTNRP